METPFRGLDFRPNSAHGLAAMNTQRNHVKSLGQGNSSWRSSLYEEPLWVSIAWIVGPVALAGLAIFFVVT